MLRSMLAAMALVLAVLAPSAVAQNFLPPDQAFQVRVESASEEAVTLRWTIADGYYLYRKELAVSTDAGATLDELELPAGKTITDPYFGVSEIYEDGFTARVPLHLVDEPPASFKLSVRHQGCAHGGLCYPPQTVDLVLNTEDMLAAASVTPTAPAPTAASPSVSEQDRLTAMLTSGALPWTLLAFFGAGLLLAFTPCVLPMLPILSSIIVGVGGKPSRYRGLILSSTYVLPMALAYAALGTAAGMAGENLQAYLQSPWVLAPFAAIFVLLALAMFGFYELRLPAGMQTRLAAMSGRQRGGQLAGVAIMGLLSALIVGPCMTAPLAGALLYIGQTGNAVSGGLALFALGLGMGTPLILVGSLGGHILPKAGAWMRQVQAVFGFVLLGVAIWMLERLLPPPLIMALWGLLLLGTAVALRALEPVPQDARPIAWLRKMTGAAAGLWAIILLIGAAAGASNPLQPFVALNQFKATATTTEALASDFETPQDFSDLQARLAKAQANDQLVVVDFYADWCVSCKIMEREVFGDPAVQQAMAGVLRLRPDVTANDADDRAMLSHFEVMGPPTLLFFVADGQEVRSQRVVGEMGSTAFLSRLQQAFGGQ